LSGLEEFLVNTASTRGSEENNHWGLGGKSPSTPIPIYRRVIVIEGRALNEERIHRYQVTIVSLLAAS
jgi:hypothetical protein